MRNSILTKKSYWRGPERLKMYYLVVSGLECVQFGRLLSFGSVNLEHGKTWMLVWFHKHSKHRVTTLGILDHPNTQFNVDTHKLVARKWKNCLVDLERQEYLFDATRLSFGLDCRRRHVNLFNSNPHSCGGWQKQHKIRYMFGLRGYLIWWNVVIKF